MRGLILFPILFLVGCDGPSSEAIAACEVFVKERLRSPSTYERISADFSGVAFESEGKSVKLVQLEYDAANAYGTPIRNSQNCSFEVDEKGQFVDDLEHAARMSAISYSEYAPCCIVSEKSSASVAETATAVDAAEAAVDAAVSEAEEAIRQAEEAAE